MALTDKNILITPNIGSSDEPSIKFTGADASNSGTITLRVLNSSATGILSFEGNSGQLFSIVDSLSGSIFSVNDISGIPSIEVLDTGLVKIAQYGGNVLVGTGTDNGTKFRVAGNAHITQLGVGSSNNPSYDFYNNGTSYFNGGVTVDDTLAFSGGNQLNFYTASGNLRGYINASETDDNHLQIAASGGEDIVFKDGGLAGTRNLVIRGGNSGTEAYGSMRSPIFYDSNDTAYYVDPAGGNARISRDLYISGNTGGNYGNRIVVGNTDTSYTLQDTNLRPTIQAHGAYPVLSLNHTLNTNSDHGPTIQFTNNGVGNQFVIGTNGTGTFLSMGYSSDSTWNPHNGIAGYSGVSFFHAGTDGNIGIGSLGDWGPLGAGSPSYNLHVKGQNNSTGGYAGVFENQVNGTNNGGGWLFLNNHSNHSWGVAAELRTSTGAGGGDRPSLLFSSDKANISWSIGYVTGSDDTFRITKNHGHRAYSGGWADNNSGWGTPYLYITTSGNVTAPVDIRSPIFYDSDNTAYYVNPGADLSVKVYGEISNSNFAEGNMQPGALNIGRTDLDYGWDNTSWSGDVRAGILANCSETWEFVIHDSGDSVESVFRYDGGDQLLMGRDIGWGTLYIQAANSFRAPIFYDSNDTAYYVDPASTTTSLQIAGTIEQGNNYAHPNVEWSASGTSTGEIIFYLPGTTSNYGMVHMVFDVYEYNGNATSTITLGGHNWNGSWIYVTCDVVGQFPHQVRLGSKDGRYVVVFGESATSWSYGTIRLRKIHNGGFYNNQMDLGGNWSAVQSTANSFSTITSDLRGLRTPVNFTAGNHVTAGGYVTGSRLWTGYDSGVTGSVSASDWFRSSGNTGWYNASYAGGIYMEDSTWVRVYNNKQFLSANIIQSNTDVRAPIFYDSNNTAYYLDPASTSTSLNIAGGLVTPLMWVNYSTSNYNNYNEGIRLYSADNGAAVITFNSAGTTGSSYSSIIGYTDKLEKRWSGQWQERMYNGYTEAYGSFRAPIFYDSNDTDYYVDPANTSRLNTVSASRFKNIYDTSTNHGFGLFFGNDESSAYAIYREAGTWDWPYPDLRIAFHTGIKIGANASYQGVKFYTDYDMGTQVMSVNNGSDPLGAGNVYVNNSLQADSSLRAPIFYDSNDTSYYGDFNSLSRMSAIAVENRVHIAESRFLYMGGTATIENSWGSRDWTSGGNRYYNARSHTFNNEGYGSTYSVVINGSGQLTASVDVRAPIFYDSNDTSFYADPNGTSRFSSHEVTSTLIHATKKTYYIGNLGASGTQARRFEVARLYIDYNDWHSAGVFQVELHNHYYFGGDYQLWNISYDYNNVSCNLISGDSPRGRHATVTCSSPVQISGDFYYISVYVDVKYYASYYAWVNSSWPAATVHQAQGGSALVYQSPSPSDISDFTASTTITTTNTIASTTGFSIPYYNGGNVFFRSATHWENITGIDVVGGSGEFRLSSTTGEINFRTDGSVLATTNVQSPIYYDMNNTAYYVDPSSTSNLYDLQLTGSKHTYLFLNPGNGYEAMIRYNGGSGSSWYVGKRTSSQLVGTESFHFYSEAAGATVGGVDTSGNIFASSSLRAPIFYDSNDTNYYIDPAGVSNVNNLLMLSAVSNNNNGLRNVMPGGGTYVTSTSSITGAIVITLPESTYPMIRFTVKVYTYDGLSFDINCGGHTSGGTWYNTFAYMTTQSRSALNVRFTYGGGNVYVYIGELGTVWSYPQVFITDVQVGYSSYEYSRWDNGWTIGFNTSTYNSISATHTVYPPVSSTNNTNASYSSVYYDSNNTAYYWDGASTSKWNESNQDGWHTFNNYGLGVTGTYDSYRLQTIFAMGSAYRMAADGASTSNMYGLAWSHPNAGSLGGANNLNDHGLLIINNGSFRAAISSRAVFSADVRGTLFYDYNNTAYYVDPNSESRLYRLRVGPYAGSVSNGSQTGLEILNNGGTGDSDVAAISFHCSGYGSMHMHLRADGYFGIGGWTASTWRWYVDVANGDMTAVGSIRSQIFYDSNNTAFYIDPQNSTTSAVVAGKITTNSNSGNGSTILSTVGTVVSTASQTGGRNYETHDFNSYPNLYSAIFINPTGSSNIPSGFSGSGYRFIMGAGDVASRGFDLLGSANTQLWFRARENGTWARALSTVDTGTSVQFGSLGIGTAASGTTGAIRATNEITAYYSDARLKTFDGKINNALEKILKLNGYYFFENELAKSIGYNNPNRQVGVSAQEVESVLPEVVTEAPINSNIENADYKTVRYEKMIPLLIEAIKEQQSQIDELKTAIKNLLDKH